MRVLVIPDIHCPYEHPKALEFCKNLYKQYNCDTVVFLGDEAEFAGLSFHDLNPDMPGAKDEYKLTLEALKKWYEAFPEAKVCTSNHTSRPYRKAFKHGIPSAFIKSYHDFLEAPKGWEWADSFTIDNVVYSHGESCKGGASGLYHSASRHRRSQVYGHWHSFAGIQYTATDNDMIFGFNVGCLIDVKALAFAYAKNFANRPTLGAGVVLNGIPHFIPMDLGSKTIHIDTLETRKEDYKQRTADIKSLEKEIIKTTGDILESPKRKVYTTEEIVDLVGWEIHNNMFSLKVRSPEIYGVVLSKYRIADDESAVVNNFTDKHYKKGSEVVNVNFPVGLSEKNRHFSIKEIFTCLMIG
jgi:hypothetical protein